MSLVKYAFEAESERLLNRGQWGKKKGGLCCFDVGVMSTKDVCWKELNQVSQRRSYGFFQKENLYAYIYSLVKGLKSSFKEQFNCE